MWCRGNGRRDAGNNITFGLRILRIWEFGVAKLTILAIWPNWKGAQHTVFQHNNLEIVNFVIFASAFFLLFPGASECHRTAWASRVRMISGRNEHRGPAYDAGTMTKEASTEHKSTDDVVRVKSGCSYGILYRTSNEQLTFAESLQCKGEGLWVTGYGLRVMGYRW